MRQILNIVFVVLLVVLVTFCLEIFKRLLTPHFMNKKVRHKTTLKLPWYKSRRFKFVPQVDNRDCGAAALASVAKYYGSDYSLVHLRELTKTDRQGTAALGIIEAAKSIGFETHSLDADMSLFSYDDLIYPFIAHVVKHGRLQHYYVVYAYEGDNLIIGDPDPNVQVIRMSREQFQAEWTGVAIFLSPRDDYQPQTDRRKGLVSFIPSFLKQKGLLFYIIMASLIITLVEIIGAFYLQVMLDEYIPSQQISNLGLIALGLIITYVIQQIIAFAKEYLLIVLGQRLTIDIILTYIKHIFILPMSFFSTRRTGEITSRFTDANQIIDAMASTIFSIILDVSMIVLVGGVRDLKMLTHTGL